MALQEDKRRLLKWLAAIGLVILTSQLMGYQAAFSSKEDAAGRKGRHAVLSQEQADALRNSGGRHAGPRQQAGLIHSVLLEIGPEAIEETQGGGKDMPRVEQLVVAMDQGPASEMGRNFVHLCIFNKLAGRRLTPSSRLQGSVEFGLGSAFPGLSPGSASSSYQPITGDGTGSLSVALDDQQGTMALSTVDSPETRRNWATIGHIQNHSLQRILQLAQEKPMLIKDCREL